MTFETVRQHQTVFPGRNLNGWAVSHVESVVRAYRRVIMGDTTDALVCSGEVDYSIMLNCLHFRKFTPSVCHRIESRAQNDMNGTGTRIISSPPGWGRKHTQQMSLGSFTSKPHQNRTHAMVESQFTCKQNVWSCVISGKGNADFLWLSRCIVCSFSKPVEIVSGMYCTFLQTLADSVSRKRLGLLSRGLLTA